MRRESYLDSRATAKQNAGKGRTCRGTARAAEQPSLFTRIDPIQPLRRWTPSRRTPSASPSGSRHHRSPVANADSLYGVSQMTSVEKYVAQSLTARMEPPLPHAISVRCSPMVLVTTAHTAT